MRKKYFVSLNEKYITENKCFWKTDKPFLSNKLQSSERIKLTKEYSTLIISEEELAMKHKVFFSSAVINIKISKFENFNPLSENIDDPTLKAIVTSKRYCNSFGIF